ncbi:endonuclease domain-containing protein [Micromonospora sp. R77]|uniref:endonuclease domain-containing protein n=1 Tax=Micromonospora sp. R77 TaxID=2925836 RepID=UPI001F626139|nr:DUF559 domain-containing protein [Micromonospora sp. R77]MCI4065727.1 endonuclease domain-containing protein [Micromonospora sp. R77]
MNGVLQALVDQGGGLVTRALAGQVVPESALRAARQSGHLVRVLPEVYVDARLVRTGPDARPTGIEVDRQVESGLGHRVESGVDRRVGPSRSTVAPSRSGPAGTLALLGRLGPELARRAALAHADGRGALGNVTALDVWGLRAQHPGEPVHLDVPGGCGLRSRPHLRVHHREGFVVEPPQAITRAGLPVVRLERALVDAWPALPPVDRAAPLIRAVNDRLTTPERVSVALADAPRLAGRADLRALLTRLAAGCRSPLEIWGHDHVFTGPDLPVFQRQVRIQARRRSVYLDVYAARERVDFELDGATTHGDRRQREIDLRRDALLATLGILVVRFTHRRLVHETDDVRREIRAILADRRREG